MISKILSRECLDLNFDIFSLGWEQRIIKIIEHHTHTHTRSTDPLIYSFAGPSVNLITLEKISSTHLYAHDP